MPPAPNIGRPLRRREDPHLIRGEGRYASDIPFENLAHLVIARSPLAHARVKSIDLEAARGMPGVLAVYTRDDLPEDARELADWLPRGVAPQPRPVLAGSEVNYVGDALAAVVAETEYQAVDAAQAVFADLEPLPAVAGVEAAIAENAPRVHEGAADNLAGGYDREFGDVEAAFADAPVVVTERYGVPRICGSAMEPRATTAEPHGEGGLRVWASTQHTYGVRSRLAATLGLEEERIEVLAEDVGGGFGPKATFYPEDLLTAFAALRLNRPVRWVATRSEDTQTTVHAHGDLIEVELAAEADGRLRGLRGQMYHDVGAYPASGPGQPGIIIAHLLSAYRLPALKMQAHLVHTNSASTGFVRGGGRPVGNYVMERMLDRLAVRIGADPVDVRRRNLVPADAMPYDTGFPAGRITVHYDSGDYPGMLAAALEAAGYAQLRREQEEKRDGRLLGVGVACCVESSGWGDESARVRLVKDGTAWILAGSTPQGQGHLTAVAQVAADRLGWPLERVKVVAGDSRTLAFGEMTAGSRTAVQVGNAAAMAARSARRWLLDRAADRLEAAAEDLVLEDGVVSVRGTPQSRVPAEELLPQEGLDVTEHFAPPTPYANAYSSGCHVAVVAVDPETGGVDIVRYVIAADTGRILNPLLHDGQLQGGFAHGLGYALFEEAIYAPDGGFQTASFLDYTIPSPPELRTEPELLHFESETPANPEGFKGVGESGTIPAPGAIANAVEDALRRSKPDARLTRLPLTPQRVLEALSS